MIHVADEAIARTTGAPASTATSASQVQVAGRAHARPAARPAGGRRGKGSTRKALEILFFVAPALVLFGMFVVWPVVKAIQFSVYKWKGYGPLVDFVGLENYTRVLQNDVFTDAITHNLIVVVASILIQLPLGLAVALLLNRKMMGQGILRTIIFVPYVLAEVIAGVVWSRMLLAKDSIVTSAFELFGLSAPAEGFLGTPDLALGTVIVVLTWKYLGLAIILFLAGLQGVPDELYEAAQIDGATWWQVQRKITIPLLGPTMRMWGFLSMVGSLQLFDMVWILTRGGPANSTTTMATFLINEGTKRQNFGIASAASVILFIIALVLALTYQKFVMSRDTAPDSGQSKKRRRTAA